MNILKPTLTLALLLTALLSPDAWAQRGHSGGHSGGNFSGGGHLGAGHAGGRYHGAAGGHGYAHRRGYIGGAVILGAPLFGSRYWYGDPFYYDGYYYPDYSTASTSAPIYLPPSDAAAYVDPGTVAPPTRRLYYCDSPQGYYPTVANCRVPWRAVTATVAQ